MKSIFSLIILYLLFLKVTIAQEKIFNPFFKEANFFHTSFEENLFNDIQNGIEVEHTDLFMAPAKDGYIKSKEVTNLIKEITATISKKKHKNEMAYLRQIFLHIHRKYLKKYQRYATFDRILEDGSFDCLTGTALYALVLSELGFPFEIHETGKHSYLKTYANNTPVLIESTDPLNGFVTQPDVMEEMEDRYAKEIPLDLKYNYSFSYNKGNISTIDFYNETISLKALAGLQYYNQAVIKYNLQNYKGAVTMLEKSYSLYNCQRVLNLLLLATDRVLHNTKINDFEKRLYSGKQSFYSKSYVLSNNK